MREIPLNYGLIALVDDEDYEELARFKWSASWGSHHAYAQARVDGRRVLMHRLLTSCPRGLEVDHLNGRTPDNRRENLEIVTRAENLARRRLTMPEYTHGGVATQSS